MRSLTVSSRSCKTSQHLHKVGFAAVGGSGDAAATNPFSPKAFLIRYWDTKITSKLPKSSFLLSKASPLNAVETATFAKLAAANTLFMRLPEFCSSAHLLCSLELERRLEKRDKGGRFAVYQDPKNFTNYGSGQLGGVDSFKNYSDGQPFTSQNAFRRYSRGSTRRKDNFLSYASESNVVEQDFHTYGTGAIAGAGEFKRYTNSVNDRHLRFTSYSDDTNGRIQSFSSYGDEGNGEDQSFTSYGKNGNDALNEFTSYANGSNVIGSNFTNYGESGNGATDKFKNYGVNMNVPINIFKNYGDGGNGATDSFRNYRDNSNIGTDSFLSFAKNSNAIKVDFTNYGKDDSFGSDMFIGYGKGAKDPKVGFKGYNSLRDANDFKEYAKKGISFAEYNNDSSTNSASMASKLAFSGRLVNKGVEPGKFFRESMLKKGTVMPMVDIRDKMPERSFLPRSILSQLPFSTSKISELKQVFRVADGSSMEKVLVSSLSECERAPSQGETKRCVGSIEDMIDFATSVLGHDVTVRTTENVNGSKKDVMVGLIKRMNGGRVTQPVSCHQSLFPYLLYYCHSVPKVRVYEADILDPNTKAKINHGVAICHLDTSAWSPTHGAFLALGRGRGRIEVCHWIFQNDMTWVIAD